MRVFIALLLLSQTVLADMDSATFALMDEKAIQSLQTRDSLGLPVLVVGLKNDGSSRNGYAEYLCQVLQDHVDYEVLVKVVDADSEKEQLLGSHNCVPTAKS